MSNPNAKLHIYIMDSRSRMFAATVMYRKSSDVRDLYNALRIFAACTLEELDNGFRLTLIKEKR